MVEQASSGLDLTSKENRIQINQLLRKKQLPEDVVKKLWTFDYYRWSILRNQKLSHNMIHDIIDNDIMKKKIKSADKVLSYLIKHQDLEKDHYEKINHDKLKQYTILDIWSIEPNKLLEHGDLDSFYNVLKDETAQTKKLQSKFIKTVKIFCSKTNKLYDMLDIFINYQNENLRRKMLEVVIRDNYIKDEYVNKIRNVLSEEDFKQLAILLIHRNHCSISMKAKLLLLK